MPRHALPLLLVLAVIAPLHAGEPKTLADRCEAIAWKLPPGSSDLVPPGLRAVQRELIDAGVACFAAIEAGLDRSLHLRRIAAEVVATWPGERSRRILLRLLADRDEPVAASAAFHLWQVGGREVLPALVAAAGGARLQLAHDALNTLAVLGAANHALEVALARLSHEQAFLRQSAASLLGEIQGARPIERAQAALQALVARGSDKLTQQIARRALRLLEARRS